MEGEDGRYSPTGLQVSWDVWDTCNSLLGTNGRGENTQVMIFFHWVDQESWGVYRKDEVSNRLTRAS